MDVFATGMNGYSALHDAVENNRFEVVKLLTKSGGNWCTSSSVTVVTLNSIFFFYEDDS